MTILLYETVASTNFATVYKDSDDPKLFYYVPQFAEVSKRRDGSLNFGFQVYPRLPDPNDGFVQINFGVNGVMPQRDLIEIRDTLRSAYGDGIRLSPVSPDSKAPALHPLSDHIYLSQRAQPRGVNLFTDLACSLTLSEIDAVPAAEAFKSQNRGWAGYIGYSVRTKKTEFKWKITANWYRMQEHFKSQISVKYWFVKANLSYETKKLIENDTIKIEIDGGTPSQNEMVYTMAEKIAARLFVPTLQSSPLASHPSKAAVCFSLGYSRIEENRTSVWEGVERAYEDKELGMAVYVGNIPNRYFPESAFRFDDKETPTDPFALLEA